MPIGFRAKCRHIAQRISQSSSEANFWKVLSVYLARSTALLLGFGGLAACAASLDLEPASEAMRDQVEAQTSGSDGGPSDLVSRVRGGFVDSPYGTFPCTETTASTLEALGFAPQEIEAVSYDRRSSGSGESSSQLTGYRAWVDFNERQGYLVISLRPNCRYVNHYTRAGLEMPNTPPP